MSSKRVSTFFFFFNDTATTEIYTLSLHDALPISDPGDPQTSERCKLDLSERTKPGHAQMRSEEHTSELQSRQYLVCRLLLEKKKQRNDSPRSRSSRLGSVRALRLQ